GLAVAGVQWLKLATAATIGGGNLTVRFATSAGAVVADGIRLERVVNHAPTMSEISNQGIDAGHTLTFSVTAGDPDGNTLHYSLGAGAPVGAAISSSGVFSWAPTS